MPVRSSVTVSLVPEARGGPFVFWDDLPEACREAKALGFDAVEVFPTSAEDLDERELRAVLSDNGLCLAAMGTGAGWLRRRLTLTLPDPAGRARARDFIRAIIELAGSFGAPAIIGSMQGRSTDEVDPDAAYGYLTDALEELAGHAGSLGVPLVYEPLNRYETNLINTILGGVTHLNRHSIKNVVLLADLFHMNIEESDIAEAIRAGAGYIGHVHYVDSNRRPVGSGHLDFAPIAAALAEIGYEGYVSAEALPWPDSHTAAVTTISAFRRDFPRPVG
ncbi:MAG: sugar phosphate isomerase/epimerase [Planctomycetia bacterium]|nr:sugar phosphate isomerase/epimerase [Planctomycetia bacterium]